MEPISEQQVEDTSPTPKTEQNPYSEEQTFQLEESKQSLPEPELVVPDIKPLLESFEEIESVEQMNNLLLSLGSYLVQDKIRLSKWIQGIQLGFAQFYIAAKNLSQNAKDMEILKEFLAIKIEQL